jgi:hypothetical protein
MNDTNQHGERWQWGVTTVMGFVVALIDLAVYCGVVPAHGFGVELKLGVIGIVTFFGLLIVSSFHQHIFLIGGDGDTGVFRDALTGSLVTVYLASLGMTLTGVIPQSSSLTQFGQVIMVVIGFYFGSKVVTQVSNNSKSGQGSSATGATQAAGQSQQ